VAGCSEHGNDTSGSTEDLVFLDQLSVNQLPKRTLESCSCLYTGAENTHKEEY
jgi:hypothetical protein